MKLTAFEINEKGEFYLEDESGNAYTLDEKSDTVKNLIKEVNYEDEDKSVWCGGNKYEIEKTDTWAYMSEGEKTDELTARLNIEKLFAAALPELKKV